MAHIHNLERRTRPGRAPSLVFGLDGSADRQGWYAEVGYGPMTLECSRLDGEDRWVIDSAWRRSGNATIPVFVHGFGSRSMGLRAPDQEICQLLDMAVADRQYVPPIHVGGATLEVLLDEARLHNPPRAEA